MESNISAHAAEALQYIYRQLPSELAEPKLGIVCGSGLGGLVDTVLPAPRHEIPYSNIPHFPSSTGDHQSRPPTLQEAHNVKCKVMRESYCSDSKTSRRERWCCWLAESSQSTHPWHHRVSIA